MGTFVTTSGAGVVSSSLERNCSVLPPFSMPSFLSTFVSSSFKFSLITGNRGTIGRFDSGALATGDGEGIVWTVTRSSSSEQILDAGYSFSRRISSLLLPIRQVVLPVPVFTEVPSKPIESTTASLATKSSESISRNNFLVLSEFARRKRRADDSSAEFDLLGLVPPTKSQS